MKQVCTYCYKVHEASFECEQKREAKKRFQKRDKDSKNYKFRNSGRWRRLRPLIFERDHKTCAVCEDCWQLPWGGTFEVHHIVPLNEDWDLRFDSDNLITLCRSHHEEAEAGKISREYLIELAKKRGEESGW